MIYCESNCNLFNTGLYEPKPNKCGKKDTIITKLHLVMNVISIVWDCLNIFLYFVLLNVHRWFNITNIILHSPEPKCYSVNFASQQISSSTWFTLLSIFLYIWKHKEKYGKEPVVKWFILKWTCCLGNIFGHPFCGGMWLFWWLFTLTI